MQERSRQSPIERAVRTPRLDRHRSSQQSTRPWVSSWPASISSATGPRHVRCRRSRSASISPGLALRRRRMSPPTPSLLPPYHRSPVSRFLLSASSPRRQPVLRIACVLRAGARAAAGPTVVDRVQTFPSVRPWCAPRRPAPTHFVLLLATVTRGGRWADLERDLELARMTVTPRQVAAMALGGTVVSRSSA